MQINLPDNPDAADISIRPRHVICSHNRSPGNQLKSRSKTKIEVTPSMLSILSYYQNTCKARVGSLSRSPARRLSQQGRITYFTLEQKQSNRIIRIDRSEERPLNDKINLLRGRNCAIRIKRKKCFQKENSLSESQMSERDHNLFPPRYLSDNA